MQKFFILLILFLFYNNLTMSEELLYWSMDEGSGSTVTDTSASSTHYTGTLTNMDNNDWVAGVSGTALELDGSNDYIINNNSNLMGQQLFGSGHNGSISFSIWFKATRGGVIVDEIGINANWHDSQVEILDNGEVKLRVWQISALSLGTTTFNEWHHVVLTYNGATNTLNGFLDGAKADAEVVQVRNSNPYSYSGYALYPLGRGDTTSLGDSRYFSGSLDEFHLFNHSLSEEEAAALYNINVPEPMSLVLLVAGFLMLAFLNKQKK